MRVTGSNPTDSIQSEKISIQVSLSGYSFNVQTRAGSRSSGWLSADKIFSTPEFMRLWEDADISLFTPKCTIVPEQFFDKEKARATLSEVTSIRPEDEVSYARISERGIVMIYSNSIDESLSHAIAQSIRLADGGTPSVYPELYYCIKALSGCSEYNKIVCSYRDGYLNLAIAQGRSLLLANTFKAIDFTTAEYFIFLCLKNLQLNPEMSTVSWRTPLDSKDEMSLYRYFKAVETI